MLLSLLFWGRQHSRWSIQGSLCSLQQQSNFALTQVRLIAEVLSFLHRCLFYLLIIWGSLLRTYVRTHLILRLLRVVWGLWSVASDTVSAETAESADKFQKHKKWLVDALFQHSRLTVGAQLGQVRTKLGPSWARLGQVGNSWSPAGASLGPTWAKLGSVGAKGTYVRTQSVQHRGQQMQVHKLPTNHTCGRYVNDQNDGLQDATGWWCWRYVST